MSTLYHSVSPVHRLFNVVVLSLNGGLKSGHGKDDSNTDPHERDRHVNEFIKRDRPYKREEDRKGKGGQS